MALSLGTGAVSLVFACCMLALYAERRRPHQFAWALGLAWYAVGALTEAWGARFGWSPSLYDWWYLAGAVCVAAYLGLGVVFLQANRWFGYLVAASLAVGSLPALGTGMLGVGVVGLAAAIVVASIQMRNAGALATAVAWLLGTGTIAAAAMIFTAHIDVALLPVGESPVTGKAAPEYVRVLTPLFNVPGAVALLGGAVVSAWRFWRRGAHPERVASNALITLGAFVDSGASSLARLGWPQAFYAGQLLGVLLIFAGFLVTLEAVGQWRRRLTSPCSGAASRGSTPGRRR